MKPRSAALGLGLSVLGGCQGNTDFWLPKNNLLPMVALADRVAFVEGNSRTAFLLDPADPTLVPRQVPGLGQAPITAMKRNQANQLLVLAGGNRGSASSAAVPAELDVIDALPAASSPAGLSKCQLDDRFDTIAQSDNGRFLVIYHSSSSQEQTDALYNQNELALVDFNVPPLSAIPKTIRSLGGVPSAILFSPPYAFQKGQRNLAVVLSQNYVTIFDLIYPNNTEISVPLCPAGSQCNLMPVQVVFDPDNLSMYVRASGAQDIYQITLTDLVAGGAAAPAPPNNDFVASLSMLAVGASPADMELYGSGKNNTLLAVAAPSSQSLVIVEPSTSQTVSVATSIPVSQIIPFVDQSAQQQALLVDSVSGSTSVIFANLAQVQESGGLALTEYPLGAAVSGVYPFVAQGIVALVSGHFSGNAALTVVNLATHSFAAYSAQDPLALPTFESDSASRLWGADEGTGLFYLNLAAGSASTPGQGQGALTMGETWLDQTITSISPLSQSSTQFTSNTTRYLVVGLSDPNAVGNLTVLDADNPQRSTARSAYGFLLSDYLQRSQP
jgi:hypothetical protein